MAVIPAKNYPDLVVDFTLELDATDVSMPGSGDLEVTDGTTSVPLTTILSLDPADFDVTSTVAGRAEVALISSGGAPLTTTDGTTSIANTTTLSFNPTHFDVTGGAGTAAIAIVPGLIPTVPAAGIVYSTGLALATEGSIFSWDSTNNRVGIGNNAPAQDLDVSRAAVAGTVAIRIQNTDNTAAGSTAGLIIATGGSTAGDSQIAFSNNTTDWSVGMDNSDSDNFLFTHGGGLGNPATSYLRVTTLGNIAIGPLTTLAQAATNGFLYIPLIADAPSGVPTAHAGKAAIAVDNTNDALNFYSNGAWHTAGGGGAQVPAGVGVVYTDTVDLLTSAGLQWDQPNTTLDIFGDLDVQSGTLYVDGGGGAVAVGGTLEVGANTAGGTTSLFFNSNTAAGAHTVLRLATASGAAGDPFVAWGVAGAGGSATFCQGIDNSVSGDPLKISRGTGIGTTDSMIFDSVGNVIVGHEAALATTATDGFLHVPTSAGLPTGVPTAYTGKAPIEVDTTNNLLKFYSTGAWRTAGGGAAVPATAGVVYTDGASLLSETEHSWDATNNRLGVGIGSPTADIHLSKSVSGGTVFQTIENTSNSSASAAGLLIITANSSGAADPYTRYVRGSENWAVGVDVSDAARFKITNATTPSSTAKMHVETTSSGGFVFGKSLAAGTDANGYIARFTEDVVGSAIVAIENTANNAASNARLSIVTAGDGAGDPVLSWGIGGIGSASYCMGIDNSVSGNPLRVGTGSTPGTNTTIEVDANRNIYLGAGTVATGANNGFAFIPVCAGTPTGGVTANGFAGLCYDSTNNLLYANDGGGWVAVNTP